MAKNVLISGASQGIGAALALEYANQGHNIFLIARNESSLQDLCSKIKEKNVEAYYSVCDVSNINQVKTSVDLALQSMNSIDIAILNAGIMGSERISALDANNFKSIYEVNVFGIVNFLECIVPIMINQKQGTIAGIGSLADSRGFPGSAAYSSSKVAVRNLLESARVELKSYGIKVITIRPGFIRTNMTSKNNFKMPFLMDADKAVKGISDAINSGKSIYSFPMPLYLLSQLAKLIPNSIYDSLLSNWAKKNGKV